MAPSKKSKSVNKRLSSAREAASSKDKFADNANKSRQQASPGFQKKRKLADMLGPQWSKEELERFYHAYRKYGKDWKKVAATVRNRSLEMVEALYTMNRAYLSLPEGTASVVGLVAMMTDHYSLLGGSDSGQESNEDTEASRKPQKRLRGKCLYDNYKALDEHCSDHSQSQSVASSRGCLSLLKKKHSGIRPHAVRKRTPRIPISYSFGKDNGEKYFSSARQGFKQLVDTNDVAHKIALALTEASQKGDPAKISGTPNKKTKGTMPSLGQNFRRKHAESELARAKFCGSDLGSGSSELSLGSTEDDNGDYSKKIIHWSSREGAGRVKNQEKGFKYQPKKLELEENVNKHLDDIKEASSGTDDGKRLGFVKSNIETDIADEKITRPDYKGPRKRSKKVTLEKDEGSAFDALKALADLSLMMPETNPDAESSAWVKEENHDVVDESRMETHNTFPRVESTASSKLSKACSDNGAAVPDTEGPHLLNAGIRKRKQKSVPLKEDEAHAGSRLSVSQKNKATDEVKKSAVKGKRSSVGKAHSRQLKMVKPPGNMSSNTDNNRDGSSLSPRKGSHTNHVNIANKGRHRRKMEKPKSMTERDSKVSGNIFSSQHNKLISSLQDGATSHKGKLINCLSLCQTRRWCTFEWFYSAIDYPWFAKREFMEYLDHVGLGHVPRLTRIEWGVIRSSLGKPRRFSEQFLKEEKSKLYQYRESVRTHYAELLAGTRDGLPTDLALPLVVGQRVIAIHPITREIHDGSILTVDHSRCRVQFDQPELGVEFVMDIDCMPLNPLENMPASLIRHNVTSDKLNDDFIELKLNGKLKQGKIEEHVIISPNENSENIEGLYISPPIHGISSLSKQDVSSSTKSQLEIGNAQLASSSLPYLLAHAQTKEADVLAVSELIRVLEKKELVLSELKHMNAEVVENQKDGGNSLKDSEPFRRHYAAVLLHLHEVNEQVSSALLCLRQRNKYQGSSSVLSVMKPTANSEDPGGQASSSNCSACYNQESLSHIAEIVESSRTKARKLVEAAVQAMSYFRKTENTGERIEEAINFINSRLSVEDSAAPATRFEPADSVHVSLASQDQLTVITSNPFASNHGQDPELNSSSDQNEVKIPSDLISHCLATLFMIQKCTERQFPPADVAQILDSAVTSLQPFSSKNLPIYAEIQKCMGILRNQILALVPT
ncbi:hypothetical protein L6164_012572 [Bauhinia variegata]|uniref:Uncharacterized protein n=1 Tax=Bauhinia variegata TaxID=167791 RepID=A0ACB9P9G6_BAUVA|nr:hypothetical protein L6164_012572 [Bauhinia variegata]